MLCVCALLQWLRWSRRAAASPQLIPLAPYGAWCMYRTKRRASNVVVAIASLARQRAALIPRIHQYGPHWTKQFSPLFISKISSQGRMLLFCTSTTMYLHKWKEPVSNFKATLRSISGSIYGRDNCQQWEFFFCDVPYMSLFRLELESYTATARIARHKRGPAAMSLYWELAARTAKDSKDWPRQDLSLAMYSAMQARRPKPKAVYQVVAITTSNLNHFVNIRALKKSNEKKNW
jgi:hypothetical protein